MKIKFCSILAILAALVSQCFGQLEGMMEMLRANPAALMAVNKPRYQAPTYNPTRQQPNQFLQQQEQQQQQQRMAELYRRIEQMTPQQLQKFLQQVPESQRNPLVLHLIRKGIMSEADMRQLLQILPMEQRKKLLVFLLQNKSKPSATPDLPQVANSGNYIISRANRIPQAPSANSITSKTSPPSQPPALPRVSAPNVVKSNTVVPTAQNMSEMMARARRQYEMYKQRVNKSPLAQYRKYQSYQKKARSAMMAGCTYPMGFESAMHSYMLFNSRGCARAGFTCYANGQSCVDVGNAVMCCPPGYTGGTLSMIGQMKKMRQIMNMFQ